MLTYPVLTKLSGPDSLFGIADWVRLRKEILAHALPLEKLQVPWANPYRNILDHGIDVEEFEQVVRAFLAHQPSAGYSLVIALDGKTLRGVISPDPSRGQHLLAAYLPAEGWALFQIEVASQENEIDAANLSRGRRC